MKPGNGKITRQALRERSSEKGTGHPAPDSASRNPEPGTRNLEPYSRSLLKLLPNNIVCRQLNDSAKLVYQKP